MPLCHLPLQFSGVNRLATFSFIIFLVSSGSVPSSLAVLSLSLPQPVPSGTSPLPVTPGATAQSELVSNGSSLNILGLLHLEAVSLLLYNSLDSYLNTTGRRSRQQTRTTKSLNVSFALPLTCCTVLKDVSSSLPRMHIFKWLLLAKTSVNQPLMVSCSLLRMP